MTGEHGRTEVSAVQDREDQECREQDREYYRACKVAVQYNGEYKRGQIKA